MAEVALQVTRLKKNRERENLQQRLVIGYALAPKKQQSVVIQPSLVGLAASRGIDLISIDPCCALVDQGPFDCIIHKLYGDDWKAQLLDFAARYPDDPVIDSPHAIERLHNRISMLRVISELEILQHQETFRLPSQVVINDSSTLSNSGIVGALHFPVGAKPLVADGSTKLHKMSLVCHRISSLQKSPAPFLGSTHLPASNPAGLRPTPLSYASQCQTPLVQSSLSLLRVYAHVQRRKF
ncbi:inositol-tetrakisphosphate 1-kinase 1 [Elaeis guineensis]|uniref:Inositol-tetrakisphosphate 1-kinase 1-like n=1 Tax=Elaeis guineensis var. tenera TaxID=51953 RepID=A0A6I9RT38_ELAGV|nr:inositol-tetrakisphosphate 1-kinase 1-like [Elaeis guineensis]